MDNASLVSIHNDAENAAVVLALDQAGNQPFWIGLHDPEVRHQTFASSAI